MFCATKIVRLVLVFVFFVSIANALRRWAPGVYTRSQLCRWINSRSSGEQPIQGVRDETFSIKKVCFWNFTIFNVFYLRQSGFLWAFFYSPTLLLKTMIPIIFGLALPFLFIRCRLPSTMSSDKLFDDAWQIRCLESIEGGRETGMMNRSREICFLVNTRWIENAVRAGDGHFFYWSAYFFLTHFLNVT